MSSVPPIEWTAPIIVGCGLLLTVLWVLWPYIAPCRSEDEEEEAPKEERPPVPQEPPRRGRRIRLPGDR